MSGPISRAEIRDAFRLHFTGAIRTALDAEGNLVVESPVGDIHQPRPHL